MSFCPMQTKAAKLAIQSKSNAPPCHKANKQSTDCDLMSIVDCSGLDLAKIDSGDHKIIKNISHIDFVWVDITPNDDFFLTAGQFIRGPPFGDIPPHLNSSDLYLTTQRLRV